MVRVALADRVNGTEFIAFAATPQAAGLCGAWLCEFVAVAAAAARRWALGCVGGRRCCGWGRKALGCARRGGEGVGGFGGMRVWRRPGVVLELGWAFEV